MKWMRVLAVRYVPSYTILYCTFYRDKGTVPDYQYQRDTVIMDHFSICVSHLACVNNYSRLCYRTLRPISLPQLYKI